MASAVSAVIGFAWANFRVFQKQEEIISQLRQQTELQEVRNSQLRITTDNGSLYILATTSSAIFLELHLMIENTGRRDSTVDRFGVEIVELHRPSADIMPREGIAFVQGRHCTLGLCPTRVLSKTGVVRIAAENTTDHGTLVFSIPGVNPATFATNGLQITGPEQKFPDLHCRLTLTDTTEFCATADFELHEQ